MRLLILLFSISLFSSADLQAQDTLVFATYNVENLFDIKDNPFKEDNEFLPHGKKNWDYTRYENKLIKLSAIIDELDADLLGLVEIENRFVLDDLVRMEKLRNRDYRIVHEESPDARGIDVALLYNPAVFQYVWHNTITINFPDEPEYRTRDILYTIGVVGDSDTLAVFMNHWPSRIGGVEKTEKSRVFVAGELRRVIDQMQALHPDFHLILSGDFNDTPNNKSIISTLNATTGSALPTAGALYNTASTLPDSVGTYIYRGTWYLYDQIIISRNLIKNSTFEYLSGSAEIFTLPFLFEQEGTYKGYMYRTYAGRKYLGGYSDHLPIRAKFVITRSAAE